MIEYVNANLIPVWVNVREDAYPNVPSLADRDWVLMIGPGGQVYHPFYYGFLVRSYVLSPDLHTLLNESDGMLGHAEMGSNGYLDMIARAAKSYKPPPRLIARKE